MQPHTRQLLTVLTAAVLLTAAASAQTFQRGDVFLGIGDGRVAWYTSSGTLVRVLNSGIPSTYTTGMAFDSAGNLYSTHISANVVARFNNSGTPLGPFGPVFDSSPESIVLDSVGNFYVGLAQGTADIVKLSVSGAVLDRFDVAAERVGADWIDLAADQRTIFYTSEGQLIRRYDVLTKAQLADFANLGGGTAFALRIVSGGRVLVARSDSVLLLNSNGSVARTYPAPEGAGTLFALNVTPDGQSFWTAGAGSSRAYKISIETGEVLQTIDTTSVQGVIWGVSVFGELVAASGITATPRTLTFNSQNRETPPPQTVEFNRTVRITSVTPPGPWLALSFVPPGSTGARLQASINPAALATLQSGTHLAVARLEDAANPLSTVDVPITLNLNTIPVVTPSSLVFTSVNRAVPPSQTVTLSFPAGAVADVITPPGGNWLMIAFVPPGTNTGTQLTASINPASLTGLGSYTGALSPGSYTANIRIVSPSNFSTLTTVPVTLNVTVPESIPTFPPVRIPSAEAVCPTTTLTVSEPYTGRLSATGGGAFIDWNVKGNFPPGLMLAGNTVVGAPNTAGTYTYIVEASSPPYSAQMTCTVTVAPGPLKITTGCPTSSAPQGSYFAFPVIPSGGMGGSSYQYSATGLPAGLIASNGRIVGTPTADPGSYNVQIQVTSGGQTATLQCSFTVGEPVTPPEGQPLRLTGACPARTYTTGETVALTVTASGGQSGYQFRISSGPPWLTLTPSGSSATITGIAPAPGNFPVEVTVSDGKSSATFSCTIVVNAPPLTISATCPAQSAFGETISIPVSASGGRGSLTWRLDGPSWLALSGTTGSSVTVSGNAPDPGEFPFAVTVTDEDGVSRQFSCTLRVTAVPVQITAAPACPARVERPAGISLDLTATGGVAPLRWQLQGPSWLSLSASTGPAVRVTGVPTAQGDHSFTVTARDDRGTTPGTFTCSFNVPAIAVPTVQITGLTASVGAMQSGDLELRLSAPAPAELQATLGVRLDPTVDLPNFTFGNPWVQFGPLTAPGSTAATVVEPYTIRTTIPAGEQVVRLGARVNLSNVAGTIRVQLTGFRAGEDNLLGTVTQPEATINLPRQAPTVFQDTVQFIRSELVFQGFSNTLDIQSVTLTFNPAADASLEGSSVPFGSELQSRVQQTFRTRFENAAAGRPTGPFMGSTFELRFPLSIEGDIEAVGSVTISIANGAGTTQSGPHPIR